MNCIKSRERFFHMCYILETCQHPPNFSIYFQFTRSNHDIMFLASCPWLVDIIWWDLWRKSNGYPCLTLRFKMHPLCYKQSKLLWFSNRHGWACQKKGISWSGCTFCWSSYHISAQPSNRLKRSLEAKMDF